MISFFLFRRGHSAGVSPAVQKIALFFVFVFFLIPSLSFAAPVSFGNNCYSSEVEAFAAFKSSWPRIEGISPDLVMSLDYSELTNNVIFFFIRDGSGVLSKARYVYLTPCDVPSLGAYPMQDIAFISAVVVLFSLGILAGLKR